MKSLLLKLIVSCALLVGTGYGETIKIGGFDGLDPNQPEPRYKVGLALSGGGARGLTAVGILRAFEEKGIKIEAIAGTSIGGIIGGLYASGYSPDELKEIVEGIDFDDLFSNSPARKTMFLAQRQQRDRHLLSVRFDGYKPVIPKAITAGQKLTNLLTTLTTRANYHAAGDFSQLPIPFKTVCTDIATGERVILDNGSLADAMRATMAFPLAFTAVELNGRMLMDGGMVTPIPVEIVKEMGPPNSFVVAVNSTSPLLDKDEIATPIDIANQVTSIMSVDKLREQLNAADYVIRSEINDLSMVDFDHKERLFEIGYADGSQAADSIIAILSKRKAAPSIYFESIVLDVALKEYYEQLSTRLAGKSFTRTELIEAAKQAVRDLQMLELDLDFTGVYADSGEMQGGALKITGKPGIDLDKLELSFRGNSIFDDSTLAAQMDITGPKLTAGQLRRGIDRVLNLYFVEEFDLTDVESVRIEPENGLVEIRLDEAILTRIDVANNRRSRSWFVRSYFPIGIGEPYSTERADHGIDNIYGTDLFDRVNIDLVPSDKGAGAHMTIRVTEKRYNQFRLGWHWDDRYESEELIEFLDDNVFGVGLEYMLSTRLGADRQDYSFAIHSNRIGRTYLTTHTTVYHKRLDRQVYDSLSNRDYIREENKTGFSIDFGPQIFRLGSLIAGIRLEEVEVETDLSETKEKFGLRVFRLQSLAENFDRIPYPRTGHRSMFELQFVGKFLGGDIEFTRFNSSLETYWPFARNFNFHPRLRVGISRSGLPVTEKFYMGGLHSFFGYHTEEILGDKMLLFNAELRADLPFGIYLIGRYDVGDVYRHTEDIKLSNLRHAIGGILAVDTPIGPFELGYGVNDEDIDRVYFQAGFDF